MTSQGPSQVYYFEFYFPFHFNTALCLLFFTVYFLLLSSFSLMHLISLHFLEEIDSLLKKDSDT